jgi:putative DNA primase/helicase
MGVSREEARRAKEKAQQARQQGQTKPNGAAPPSILDATTIGATTVSWLWYPRLPAGQISLLGAPGGGGKGLNAAEYTAIVTTGRPWPDGTPGPEPGHVLWCETEDPLAEVVVPRLIAAGADRSRVSFASRQAYADLGNDGLKQLIRSRGTRLIIMSPLVSFLTGLTDINGELGVRDVLERLQATIDHTGCAALGLAHTSKKADLRAIERLLGSVAFTNFGRSVLLVSRDKEDPDWFRLVHGKHNLSTKAHDLLYRPKHVGEDPRDQFVRLEWRVPDHDVDPDALFDRERSKGNGKLPARDWLISYLGERGRVLASEVLKAGEKAGYSRDAVSKAEYRESRIDHDKEGFPAQVWWFLR